MYLIHNIAENELFLSRYSLNLVWYYENDLSKIQKERVIIVARLHVSYMIAS